MQVTAVSHRVRSAKRVYSAVRHSSLNAESTRNGANWGTMVIGRRRGLRPGRCACGFFIATAVDQRALDSLRFVLDSFRFRAEKDEEARIVGPAVPLRIAAGGSVLPASAQRALWVAGGALRSCERRRRVERRCSHRRRRGYRDLGALASWRDRKSTRLNSSHQIISYAVFCLKKKKTHYTLPAQDVMYRILTTVATPVVNTTVS